MKTCTTALMSFTFVLILAPHTNVNVDRTCTFLMENAEVLLMANKKYLLVSYVIMFQSQRSAFSVFLSLCHAFIICC